VLVSIQFKKLEVNNCSRAIRLEMPISFIARYQQAPIKLTDSFAFIGSAKVDSKMVATVLFVLLIAGANGQRYINGECPSYSSVTNFQLDKYLGNWLEFSRYDGAFQRGGDCVTAEYSAYNTSYVKVTNSMKLLPDQTRISIEGSARLARPDESPLRGELKVRFNDTKGQQNNDAKRELSQ